VNNSTTEIQKKTTRHQGTVLKLNNQFCATGSVADKRRSYLHSVTKLDHTSNVLAKAVVSPHKSMQKTGHKAAM
jgi:hypothetical protein